MRNAKGLALLWIAASTAARPTLSTPFSDQLLDSSKKPATLSESAHALYFNPGVRIAPNRSFRIKLRSDTFKSTANSDLICTATADDQAALPPWLDFDSTRLVFEGRTPSTTLGLNVTVACSDSSKSDPARDWFMVQVGNHSLELKQPLDPLEAMASNDVRFNASSILGDVMVEGSEATEEDEVNLTVVVEDVDWLQWDSSSKAVRGRVPDHITGLSPTILVQISDRSGDNFTTKLPITLKESFFYSAHLPALPFVPYQPFFFDLRPFIRVPISANLSISMQITNSTDAPLSTMLKFDSATFIVTSTAPAKSLRFNRRLHSNSATPGDLASGTLLFTATDLSTGFISQTSVDILPPINGSIVVAGSAGLQQKLHIALIVILCVITALCILFALLCFWNVRRGRWQQPRLMKTYKVQEKQVGDQGEPNVGTEERNERTSNGVHEEGSVDAHPTQPRRSILSSRRSTAEDAFDDASASQERPSGSQFSVHQPSDLSRSSAHSHHNPAANMDTSHASQDHSMSSHPRNTSSDQRTPDSTVPRRHPLMKIARAISPSLLRDSVNRIRSVTPGSSGSPRYDLSGSFAKKSDSTIDTSKADLYTMMRRPGHQEQGSIAEGDDAHSRSGSSDSLREVSRGISGLPNNPSPHPLGSYWSPSRYGDDSFRPQLSSSPSRRNDDYASMSAAELSARLEQSSRDLNLSDLQSSPVRYTGYRGSFVPNHVTPIMEELDLGDIPSAFDSPFGPTSWPMQARSRKVSTSYSQGRLPRQREEYESSPETSFHAVADLSREGSREFRLTPRWDFSLCPLPSDTSQHGDIGLSLTGNHLSPHLRPPTGLSGRDDSKNWEY